MNEEMKKVKEHFKNDHFATSIGVKIMDLDKGYCKAKMEIESRHLNSVGTVQGGAMFTLADLAFAVASNAHGNVALAISTNMSFVKAVSSGTLFAEAREESINPKISTYHVKVTNEKDELIAIFQGMAYRKKDIISDFYKK